MAIFDKVVTPGSYFELPGIFVGSGALVNGIRKVSDTLPTEIMTDTFTGHAILVGDPIKQDDVWYMQGGSYKEGVFVMFSSQWGEQLFQQSEEVNGTPLNSLDTYLLPKHRDCYDFRGVVVNGPKISRDSPEDAARNRYSKHETTIIDFLKSSGRWRS